MKYQLDWFPKNTSYDVNILRMAAEDQPDARNVTIVSNVPRYGTKEKITHPTAVQITVTGGYPTLASVVYGMNKYIQKRTGDPDQQKITFRTISTAERKKIRSYAKPKRKIIKNCSCKKK